MVGQVSVLKQEEPCYVAVHLGDRDIKASPRHVLLGLAVGVSVVATLYYLEPNSPAYELCKQGAQTAYEECRDDAASQNDGPIKQSENDCGRKRQQDLLACYS